VDQLASNVARLKDLIEDNDGASGENPDDRAAAALQDAKAARVDSLRDLPILVALGGSVFSTDTVQHVRHALRRRSLTAGWFQVQLEGTTVMQAHLPADE
jgi:hypothetical protein